MKVFQDVMPADLPTPKDALTVWVIYEHPADYPDKFVLRPQFSLPGGEIAKHEMAWTADDIEQLRDVMRDMGLVRMERHRQDDPKIVETWV